jgi:hypothetical protein
MRGPSKDVAKKKDDYKFWNTQPVPALGMFTLHPPGLPINQLSDNMRLLITDDEVTDHGSIEAKTLADVSREPYSLPSGFNWVVCDLTDAKVVIATHSSERRCMEE